MSGVRAEVQESDVMRGADLIAVTGMCEQRPWRFTKLTLLRFAWMMKAAKEAG